MTYEDDDQITIDCLKETYGLFNKWTKVELTVDEWIEPDYEALDAISKVLSLIMTRDDYEQWKSEKAGYAPRPFKRV